MTTIHGRQEVRSWPDISLKSPPYLHHHQNKNKNKQNPNGFTHVLVGKE